MTAKHMAMGVFGTLFIWVVLILWAMHLYDPTIFEPGRRCTFMEFLTG